MTNSLSFSYCIITCVFDTVAPPVITGYSGSETSIELFVSIWVFSSCLISSEIGSVTGTWGLSSVFSISLMFSDSVGNVAELLLLSLISSDSDVDNLGFSSF